MDKVVFISVFDYLTFCFIYLTFLSISFVSLVCLKILCVLVERLWQNSTRVQVLNIKYIKEHYLKRATMKWAFNLPIGTQFFEIKISYLITKNQQNVCTSPLVSFSQSLSFLLYKHTHTHTSHIFTDIANNALRMCP